MGENFSDLKNKTIVVTGASSGIGKEISINCSLKGANLVLIARDENRLKETIKLMKGENHSFYSFDLKDTGGMRSIVSKIIESHGKIDGLVHAAGIESTTPLKVLTTEILEDMFKINVFSAVELTRLFVSKKHFNNGGSVIFLSSVMGTLGERGKIAYCGSKAAIRNMVKPLALELSNRKIRVNSVSPGVVLTEMTGKMFASISKDSVQEIIKKHPLGIGEPRDIAQLCAFLLSNESKWITGSDLVIDGGYSIS